MDTMDDTQIAEGLTHLHDWTRHPDRPAIRRAVTAPDYMTGIHLVEAVARAAEEAGHHPDIDIRYTDVTFHQSTHSAGGVTVADFQLAARIDEIIADTLGHGTAG